jgi:4-amino-4-deoxy-L-arabinose transferase-like glycosyltransferase
VPLLAKHKALKIAAGIAASFISFVAVIIMLARTGTITVQLAGLMLVSLVGLYLGFGILIAVYRFISKLD